jgi:hypothetical protein
MNSEILTTNFIIRSTDGCLYEFTLELWRLRFVYFVSLLNLRTFELLQNIRN